MKLTFLSRIAGLVILSLGILFTGSAQAGSSGKQYWLETYNVSGYLFVWPVTGYIPGAATVWLTDGEYGKLTKAYDGVDYAETDMRNKYLKGGGSNFQDPNSVPGCFVIAGQLKNHSLWNYIPANDPSEVPGCKLFTNVMPEEIAKWGQAFVILKYAQEIIKEKAGIE
jgi:hypothetical protein